MAVVRDFFVLCKSDDVIGATDGHLPDTILVSHCQHSKVSLYNVSDIHLIRDWSIKSKVSQTGLAVALQNNQFGRADKTTVKIWNGDNDSTHNVKLSRAAHRLFRFPSSCDAIGAMVLYTDGTLSLLSDMSQCWGAVQGSEQGSIVWADVLYSTQQSNQSWIVVIINKSKSLCIARVYKVEEESGRSSVTVYETAIRHLVDSDSGVTYCLQHINQTLFLLKLSFRQGLTRIPLVLSNQHAAQPGGEEEPLLSPVIYRATQPLAMVALDDSQIVVAGLGNGVTVGVGVWDFKYGVLHCFSPLSHMMQFFDQSNLSAPWQLHRSGKYLVLVSTAGVHACAFQYHKSTLVGCANRQASAVLAVTAAASYQDDVASVLARLADEKHTPNLAEFRRTFQHLSAFLLECTEKPDSRLSVLPLISAVIARCLVVSWCPTQELHKIITAGLVASNMCKLLFTAMQQRKDLRTLYLALLHTPDIPESALVIALSTFLSATDEAASAVDCESSHDEVAMETEEDDHKEEGREDEDSTGAVCPFSKSKMRLINLVLSHSCNKEFMIKSLRSLESEHILLLMKFLHYLLAHGRHGNALTICDPTTRDSAAEVKRLRLTDNDHPTWLQVVDWLYLLNVSHGVNISVLLSGREIVEALQRETAAQYQQLLNQRKTNVLEEILEESARRARNNRDRTGAATAGEYCISTLHIY